MCRPTQPGQTLFPTLRVTPCAKQSRESCCPAPNIFFPNHIDVVSCRLGLACFKLRNLKQVNPRSPVSHPPGSRVLTSFVPFFLFSPFPLKGRRHDPARRQLRLDRHRCRGGPPDFRQPEEVDRVHADVQHSGDLALPGVHPVRHSAPARHRHHSVHRSGNRHGKCEAARNATPDVIQLLFLYVSTLSLRFCGDLTASRSPLRLIIVNKVGRR